MKKFLVIVFGCLTMFLMSAVLACENCDCGCQDGQKCNCKKECPKDCDCGCHNGKKCDCNDCKCKCHKKKCAKNCDCGCQENEKCNREDCKCGCHEDLDCTDKNCDCSCHKKSKAKKSIKNLFKRNKIKCNCEE